MIEMRREQGVRAAGWNIEPLPVFPYSAKLCHLGLLATFTVPDRQLAATCLVGWACTNAAKMAVADGTMRALATDGRPRTNGGMRLSPAREPYHRIVFIEFSVPYWRSTVGVAMVLTLLGGPLSATRGADKDQRKELVC